MMIAYKNGECDDVKGENILELFADVKQTSK